MTEHDRHRRDLAFRSTEWPRNRHTRRRDVAITRAAWRYVARCERRWRPEYPIPYAGMCSQLGAELLLRLALLSSRREDLLIRLGLA